MTATVAPYVLTGGETRWNAEAAGAALGLLARTEDTAGNLLVLRYDAPPGWPGPPLHQHDLDEAMYVLAGRFTVRLGEDTHELGAGDFAWMPRNVPHGFATLGEEPASFLGLAAPPGRMQQFFEAAARELADAEGPPDPERLMQLNAEHGIEVLGPPIGAPSG